MKWLWSRWLEVKEQVHRSGHTLLFLDYDGTLAPIAPSPEQAKLTSATKSALRQLSHNPKVTVALISGRALADLRQQVELKNLTYVGNHGLQIWREGRRTTVVIPKSSREALRRISPRLARLVTDFRGARLEDKSLSISLHYRLLERSQVTLLKSAFRCEVLPFIQSGALTITSGKKVIEVRPNLNWTKGRAVLWLIKRTRRRSLLPIYIGDDRTDEDAFDALTNAITIRVGAHRRSKARYYVRNTREVVTFLEWIASRLA